jgi:predicted acyltransferase (DUF342 family)
LNSSPRDRLCLIVAEHGPAICDDTNRVEALLCDYCAPHRGEIAAIVAALRGGVAAELRKISKGPLYEVALKRLSKRLQQDSALSEEAASWAVESVAVALGCQSYSVAPATGPNSIAHESRPEPPLNPLGRVEIRQGADVQGVAFGDPVYFRRGARFRGSAVSKTDLTIEKDADVSGTFIAGATLRVEGKVGGDLFAQNISIPAACRVEGRMLSRNAFTLPESSAVTGGIVAWGGCVTAGANCSIGDVLSKGLEVSDRCTIRTASIQGDLTAGNGFRFGNAYACGSVLLGKGAAGTAIFAEGDVHVGENSSLSLVSATGRVELGRGAQADLVIGEEVVLCEQSVVGKVCASGDLTVRSGARLGDACALRRIALERAVSLSSWSLICPNGEIAFDSGVTLHGVLVDPSNSFWIGRDGQLMYQRDLEQCGMVVTALMNHELLSAIHELTPCRATIHG